MLCFLKQPKLTAMKSERVNLLVESMDQGLLHASDLVAGIFVSLFVPVGVRGRGGGADNF